MPSSVSNESISATINSHIQTLSSKYPTQTEFISAVSEQLSSLIPFFSKYPKYLPHLSFITHPDFLYTFKVNWEDDSGFLQTNTGYRCHFNSAIGPYKGGLRFSPTVTESIIKFLAFEQTFKNALTGLPMGGAKGGSDFNPKGKSPSEIRRFCISFAQQLHKIGISNPEGRVDTPAGDIGVSSSEIGIIFGELKKLSNSVPFASLTGKPLELGGSLIRPEATGYGVVYILLNALKNEKIENKNCLVTGSGNVALFCAEKLIQLKSNVLSVSDSNGVLIKLNTELNEPKGINMEELNIIKEGKFCKKKRLFEICEELNKYNENNKNIKFKHFERVKVWDVFKNFDKTKIDILCPCATQNEISLEGAKQLKKLGLDFVSEGANMPTDNDAIDFFVKNISVFIPAKAANAGGVAVSGLEMAQNGMRKKWSREKVDGKLKEIMKNIYENISGMAKELGDEGNLVLGANSAGFKIVMDAHFAEGRVWE